MSGNDAGGERRRRLSELLDQALELDDEVREQWLASLAHGPDAAFAEELRAVLAGEQDADYSNFLSGLAPAPPGGRAMIGRRVGAYVIESEIGSGGMGSVWRATRADGQFESYVAIKFVHAAWLGRAGEQRFRREGRLLARLNHPRIARLIDAGVLEDGQPYLVLEYVSGEPIDAFCESRALDVPSRVRLFLDVLDAVAHAHRHLIVHRDVKPSNVLVTGAGEVKLLDFGIAKPISLDAACEATRSGIALTPDYAAPEQLSGDTVTTATDVYALGLVLRRLLASVTAPKPKDDLDTIVAKATRSEPRERYATVDAFADDLKRYLNNEPVQARRDTLAYRTAKFVRRNRGGVALGALIVLALIGATIVTATQLVEARQQRDRAQAQLERAQAFDDLVAIVLSAAEPEHGLKPRELLDRGQQLVRTEFASDPALRAELMFSLATLYLQAGETAKEKALETEAHQLAQRAGDAQLMARTGCSIARSDGATGKFKEASERIDQYLADLPAGAEYDGTRAHCLIAASIVASAASEGKRALDYAQAAARLQQASPGTEWLLLRTLMTLAAAQNAFGHLGDASATFERVERGFERLQVADTGFAKTLRNNWAIVLLNLGQPRRGAALSERALAYQTDSGSVDAYTKVVYAANLLMLERFDEARRVLESAAANARANGNANSAVMVNMGLANVLRETGDLGGAARVLDVVTSGLEAMHMPSDHEAMGALYLNRAQLAQERGDFATAIEHSDAALSVFSTKPGLRRRAANVHLVRSEIYADMKDGALARTEASLAIEMYQEVLGPNVDSYYLGRSFLALARAEVLNGESDRAHRTATQARRHLISSVGESHSLVKAAAGI